jgi:type II secretory pathway pseudopilin PulG
MKQRRSPAEGSRKRRESGHLILCVMIGLTVAAILLAAAVQQWSVVERREREEDLIFRGTQYVKAIRLYQMEHGGALPTSLEILIKPGPRGYRYIRKLYRDPFAPDGKWGILLADPSGRGYINPNAPLPAEGVPGLEDLGQGFRDEMDAKLRLSSGRNRVKQRAFAVQSGFDFKPLDPEGESVTAPDQPTGPIVGVISLWDQTSFRRYKEHENYADWAFHIFDLPGAQKQAPQAPVPSPPNQGIGPGGSQTIFGGKDGCIGKDCPPKK